MTKNPIRANSWNSCQLPIEYLPSNQVYFLLSFRSWVVIPGSWFLTKLGSRYIFWLLFFKNSPKNTRTDKQIFASDFRLQTPDSLKISRLPLRQAQDDSSKWQRTLFVPIREIRVNCPLNICHQTKSIFHRLFSPESWFLILGTSLN